jgi:hypothetical protein
LIKKMRKNEFNRTQKKKIESKKPFN